jgi:hypothetical protein
MAVSEKFARERHLVELLMQRLGIVVSNFIDPNDKPNVETGVDVVADTALGHLGIQVTELDTGHKPGLSRAAEKAAAREGVNKHGGVYGAWAQNDTSALLAAIGRSISRKAVATTVAGFDEVWLLISCGVPEIGSVASTLVMTPWLDALALDNATLSQLSQSKYRRAFLHSILGVERALYQWEPNSSWTKTVQEEPSDMRGPSFWDFQRLAKGRS